MKFAVFACLLLLSVAVGGVSAQDRADAGKQLEQPPEECIVCGNGPLFGTVWKHSRGWVCDECHKLERQCWICGLPAREKFLRTEDGRYICRFEAGSAVMTEAHAQQIFQRTRNSVKRMTRGFMSLRQPKVNVESFGVDYWNNSRGARAENPMHRTGIAFTRRVGEKLDHTVLLLSGQVTTNLAGVSAHEFTHLWINENKPPDRDIEPQTEEAICELVAYKLAQSYGHTNLMHTILENAYTEGRVRELVAAERRYGLGTILRWVTEGRGARLDARELAALKRTSGTTAGAASARPMPRGPVPRQASPPEQLRLKGLLGRMALINGMTIEEKQKKRMRLGDQTLVIECVRIGSNFVELRVDGEELTLSLSP